MYYVYAHLRKTDGSIFYIGKGSGSRAFVKKGRNSMWNHVFKKHGCLVVILSKWDSEEDAFKEEERLIAEIGIKNLTNMAYGGAWAKGVEFSKERKDIHRRNLETCRLKIHDLSLIARKKNKKRIFTECGRSFLGASAVKEWMNKELGIACNSTTLISHAAAKGWRCCGIKLRYKGVKFMEENKVGHRARAVGNSDGMIFPSILKAAEYMRSIGEICSSPSIHGAMLSLIQSIVLSTAIC